MQKCFGPNSLDEGPSLISQPLNDRILRHVPVRQHDVGAEILGHPFNNIISWKIRAAPHYHDPAVPKRRRGTQNMNIIRCPPLAVKHVGASTSCTTTFTQPLTWLFMLSLSH